MNDQQQTIIGANTQISGHLQGTEDLTVYGRIDGQITLEHTLTVEPSGVVVADVNVAEAVISGAVVGNITASGAIHIAEGGKVVGDLRSPRVILVDGALFRGNIDMGDVEHAIGEVALREAPARKTTAKATEEPKKETKRPAPRPARPPRRVSVQRSTTKKSGKAQGRQKQSLQEQASAAAKAVRSGSKKEPARAKAPLIKKSSKKKVVRKVPKPPTAAGKKSRAKRK